MDLSKIKLLCQFCLQEPLGDRPSVVISKQLKQNFLDLTQKKLNTARYSENICCEPCLHEFEAAIKYRDGLLKNQKVLEDLYISAQRDVKAMKNIAADNSPMCQDDSDGEDDDNKDFFVDESMVNIKVEPDFVFAADMLEFPTQSKVKSEFTSDDEEALVAPKKTRAQRKDKKAVKAKKLDELIDCPQCDRQFTNKTNFNFHLNDVHREDRTEICPVCGKAFKNRRRMNAHLTIHQEFRKFQCDICSKRFRDSGALTRHKRIHDDPSSRPFKCTFCPKTFVQSPALKAHLDVHNNVTYTCDSCGTVFRGKVTLRKHLEKCIRGIKGQRGPRGCNGVVHKKYKCFAPDCDRVLSCRPYLEVHLDKVHNMRFDSFETMCLVCLKVCASAGEYIIHSRTHTHNFICTICKQPFKEEKTLANHMKNHKDDEDRPFICMESDCGASFKKSGHLKSHHLYKHSKERNVECEFCDFKCCNRAYLNVHMRTHTKSKPFLCWSCEYTCITSNALRDHMKFIHKESRIYCCKRCRKPFQYQQELAQHEKEHSAV